MAAVAERTIRAAAPRLARVIRWGAPTYRGHRNVLIVSVLKDHVAVGFWRGTDLEPKHAMLEGKFQRVRIVRLRTVTDAKSRALTALVRDAAALDAATLVPGRGGAA